MTLALASQTSYYAGMIQVNPKNQNTRVVRCAGGGAAFAVPFSKAPDFIAGAAKSTTTANANPQREGYAFGAGEWGDGYYRFGTAHGDEIMRVRLEKMLKERKDCAACFFCFGCYAKEIAELEALIASGDYYSAQKARRAKSSNYDGGGCGGGACAACGAAAC